ncbi:aspartate kinase [Carboxylicivirga sp. M1479]|uniref:aspartate kinase n=1 Tax=Carboxylicivirga sp. M1479 TaxID=2594476 RepID=UPI00117773BA|nr:aspartate kinase [Carboxylicivirga sp. M1479]TRX72153.1 aspartate kinase [Carboxylicivirga sp. M1479]
MKVLKFGGTSVGSAQRMKEVAEIISDNSQKIVVLSAMSGTTNSLVEIANNLYQKKHDEANTIISTLEKKYEQEVELLYSATEYKTKGKELIKSHFDFIRSFTVDMFTVFEEKSILAQGELISTALFHFFLQENGHDSALLPALDYMRIDKNNEPDMDYIKENIANVIKEQGQKNIYITQGYICRNAFGEIDNLQRGGSDYSASLIGSAIAADEIQIWTDIDGMHNNDPRYVENTKSLSELSYDEAAELAYFGAKILHPTSVLPAKLANIPVRLLNTMAPEAEGTLISSKQRKHRMAAVAAKDGITAIKIKSGRMLLAYGFLRKVFEIFESYKTPIDMITTSEVGVSVTIDENQHLEEIVNDLKKYGSVEVDTDQVIVCVVGDLIAENKGYASTIFEAMQNIPIRMISYGGSNYNLSLLINAQDKKQALNLLSDQLFN